MPGGRERFKQKRPAATLLLSVNCLYQMNKKNCKREFKKCMRQPVLCGTCDDGCRFHGESCEPRYKSIEKMESACRLTFSPASAGDRMLLPGFNPCGPNGETARRVPRSDQQRPAAGGGAAGCWR